MMRDNRASSARPDCHAPGVVRASRRSMRAMVRVP